MAQQNKVDGIIGLTYNPDLVVDDNIPFVAIDRSIRPNIPCVSSDNFAGGQIAAEKLADLGCKKKWLSCASAHRLPTSQTSARQVLKTAVSPGGLTTK